MINKIIPSILVFDKKIFSKQMKSVEGIVEQVHIDIMDNRFVNNQSFRNYREIKKFKTKLKYSFHLMVKNVYWHVCRVIKINPEIIFVHHNNSKKEFLKIVTKIKKNNIKVGLVVSPKDKVEQYKNILDEVDCVLLMTVVPGKGGQKFMKKELNKIKIIKKYNSSFKVYVDGGLNSDTILEANKYGADYFSVNSAIFKSGNIKKSILLLNNKIK